MNKKMTIFFIILFFTGVLFEMRAMDKSKLEKMRMLKKGTSYTEIVSEFGEPDEDLGSGLLIVSYVFPESKIVLHFFTGDSLQGLREIKKTGEEIVYIPLELVE